MATKTRIIRIGNSRGVRIPKAILEQSGLNGEVELVVQKDGLLLRKTRKPREGWAEAFKEMHARGEDALLDGDAFLTLDSDDEEWVWEMKAFDVGN